MQWFYTQRHAESAVEEFGSSPSGDGKSIILYGLILPVLVAGWAMARFLLQGFPWWLPPWHWPSQPRDLQVAGAAGLAAALFLHLHFCWCVLCHDRIWPGLLKIVALLVFIAALGYLIVQAAIL